VLHTDTSVLPKRRRAWAAWNYERATQRTGAGSSESVAVCLHYLLNRLQPLPFSTPVLVSLNPVAEPRANTVLGEFDYAHPVFDMTAIAAQQQLGALQGQRQTWYCGAWTRYGFHEDGLMSGLTVRDGLLARLAESVSAPAREVA
jgi:predicted NAD/FAD-binding protein